MLSNMLAGTGVEDARISTEVAFGLQLNDGMTLLAPNASLLRSDGNNRYGIGIGLINSKVFDFQLEGVRQVAKESATEILYRLNSNVRW